MDKLQAQATNVERALRCNAMFDSAVGLTIAVTTAKARDGLKPRCRAHDGMDG